MSSIITIPSLSTPLLEIAQIQVDEGHLTEVLPSRDPGSELIDTLNNIWSTEAHKQNIKFAWPLLPHVPRAVIFLQFFPRMLSVASCVARQTKFQTNAINKICEKAKVDPDESITKLDWTTRKILGFEIACMQGRVVIVDDIGLDPQGERRFGSHVVERLNESRLGGIAIRRPVRGTEFPWSDTQVIINLSTNKNK